MKGSWCACLEEWSHDTCFQSISLRDVVSLYLIPFSLQDLLKLSSYVVSDEWIQFCLLWCSYVLCVISFPIQPFSKFELKSFCFEGRLSSMDIEEVSISETLWWCEIAYMTWRAYDDALLCASFIGF